MKIVTTVESVAFTTEYDKFFRKYSEKHFGSSFDWRWFKAQGIAESMLDPDAESWCGAKGIMQIMPGTFKDIKREINSWIKSVDDPEQNIAAGIYYDRKLGILHLGLKVVYTFRKPEFGQSYSVGNN